MTVLADDLARAGYCTSSEDLFRQIQMWDSTLDRHLATLGISQNLDKSKFLVANPSDFPLAHPSICKQLEYVGSVLSHDGSIAPEIQQRLKKAKRAWMTLRKFWSSAAPEKFKVTCYRALVQNALLSGLEAAVLDKEHIDKMEMQQMQYLRKLMCGGACYKTLKRTLDGRQYVQFNALTNQVVRELTGVPTLQSELSARRLKWLQQLVRWYSAGAPTLHLLEAKFLWESEEQISQTGKLTQATNPWTLQFYSDIKTAVRKLPHLQQLFGSIGWWFIYTEEFQTIKPCVIKSYDSAAAVVVSYEDFAKQFETQGDTRTAKSLFLDRYYRHLASLTQE
eukprot:TRINITY_DN6238_c0_g1_i1.p1 TRINITY_DN6238_c0_g1~~TRINITY_DN6238_c0_g1_i1.p1  ORF type:complete len:336 (-),score=45.12 TRINITY_DN6238_c0_g1_i1:318-1325(-)